MSQSHVKIIDHTIGRMKLRGDVEFVDAVLSNHSASSSAWDGLSRVVFALDSAVFTAMRSNSIAVQRTIRAGIRDSIPTFI
jgi:hypothetical protein